jgi:hypothetical protein
LIGGFAMPAFTQPTGTVSSAVDDPDDFDPASDTGEYDPQVASDGLTLDTEFGPVDRVVIERAWAGRDPGSITDAEFAYLLTTLPPSLTAARPLAAALSVSADALRKRAQGAPITARKVA